MRKLAQEAAAEGLLPASKVGEICSVKGARILGERTGNWLTKEQAQQILALPDQATLKGKRDRALLSLFLTAGVRREELASLCIEQIGQRDGRPCLVDLVGKGGRVRTVAIPEWTWGAVEDWIQAMPFRQGVLLGKVNKGGRFVGQGLTASALYAIVLGYARQLGVKCGRMICGGRMENWRTRVERELSRSNSPMAMPRSPQPSAISALIRTCRTRLATTCTLGSGKRSLQCMSRSPDTAMTMPPTPLDNEQAFANIVELIAASQLRAVRAVNTALVDLYWQVGEIISRKLQKAE